MFEMIWKNSYSKIDHLISAGRKYFALERRQQVRYPSAINVEFYAWDAVTNKPLTTKGAVPLLASPVKAPVCKLIPSVSDLTISS